MQHKAQTLLFIMDVELKISEARQKIEVPEGAWAWAGSYPIT